MLLKRVRSLIAAVAFIVCAQSAMAQNATGFASVIDDLPLMAGLSEAGDGVEFSTPQGRIAEVTVTGKLSRKAVEAFYAKTLPQLGWTRIVGDDMTYMREGETLTLVFSDMDPAAKDMLRMRFFLVPYSAAGAR